MSALRLARGATGREPHPQVRGLLPRPRGRPAGRRRQRRRHARHPGLAGRAGGLHRADRAGALQRSRRGRRRLQALGRRPRLRHRRAGGGQHGPGAAGARASSRGCASCAIATGALLIFDEVMTGFRTSLRGMPRACTGRPGPDLPRQGGGRRDAGRRLRRQRRPDGPHGAGRAHLPGGHALREPAGDGRRHRDAAPPAKPGSLRAARRLAERLAEGALEDRAAGGGRGAHRLPTWAGCSGSSSTRARCGTSPTPRRRTRRASAASSPRCSSAGSTWRPPLRGRPSSPWPTAGPTSTPRSPAAEEAFARALRD